MLEPSWPDIVGLKRGQCGTAGRCWDRMRPIRILIADAHDAFRRQLVALLRGEPYVIVVDEAVDEDEALQRALALQPDVVLADVELPRAGGLSVARALSGRIPSVRVLLMAWGNGREYVEAALRNGAGGCLDRRRLDQQLLPLLRAMSEDRPVPLEMSGLPSAHFWGGLSREGARTVGNGHPPASRNAGPGGVAASNQGSEAGG